MFKYIASRLLIASVFAACSASDDEELDGDANAAAATVKAASGFDTDADGWTVTGDAQASSVKPDFAGTGGNPGGLITAVDNTTGGVFYFVAPAKYLGDASTALGKKLTFDLRTTSAAASFAAYGVMLSGGGKTVIAILPSDPTPAGQWKSYSFVLGISGGWKLVSGPDVAADDTFATAPAATEADIRTVLSKLQLMRIRGEFNTGPDTGSLDNVKLGA